jgi:hypothetical protein
MEKNINKRIEEHSLIFKDEIKNKLISLNLKERDKVNEILQFVYDYDRLILVKEDLLKPKRMKIEISMQIRCCAKRVNGEQCSRRKIKDVEYCGTHYKGLPFGKFECDNKSESIQKLNVFAEDIQGIIYYVDRFLNVYDTHEILEEKENPKIIAKAAKNGNVYTIPEFGLI